MPKLATMEIWNGRKGFAALFRYQLFEGGEPAVITWRGTWEFALQPPVVRAWENVALEHRGSGITTVTELLDSATLSSHGSHDRSVVTDLTVCFCISAEETHNCTPESQEWKRIEKELYLHTAQQTAWLQVAQVQEEDLTADDLVVTDIRVGELEPNDRAGLESTSFWEGRPGGIWLKKGNYLSNNRRQPVAVTSVDLLFGVDAVDPRPQWTLLQEPLQLPDAQPEVPVPRLTIRFLTPDPDEPRRRRIPLRVREDGTFKIVQISDTHMVTGVGVCKDAIDAHGQPLPPSEADPLTADFIGTVLDVEKPELVILTGDQLHHDIPDSQSAIFKVVAPLIERRVPYAAVFGNHDSEGAYSLPRAAQMSVLQGLPFSLCQPGPEHVDGVGNYHLPVLAHGASSEPEVPLSTLYFLDSHGQIPSKVKNPDYDWIKQSQIDWFTSTSQALRRERDNSYEDEAEIRKRNYLSLAFLHIPLPEYADNHLIVEGGRRREPTEGPSSNSHLYSALAREGIAAVGCGHDHVNDFCGLLPQHDGDRDDDLDGDGSQPPQTQLGPWLCYGGGSGFGGYCSYDEERYHRRMRVWELDTETGGIKTWKRVEYSGERIDEMVLVEAGAVVSPQLSSGVYRSTGSRTTQDEL
ncbi:hypothetical protein VMCG_00509 [Cytospora schulzeri]|uniref:Uncharacterized protein n=1 Tax=Cytospora schulzeri TaxID=448051 RepID=A0A423X941_9PEZI|nr:hypothetical protein VMCG_00509 [Valsa malicola]